MLGRNYRWSIERRLVSFLMAVVLSWGLAGCGSSLRDRIETAPFVNEKAATTQLAGQLAEVAPPPVIQKLAQDLDAYQPQVAIVNPKADEVLQDTTVSVKFQVQDLPIFKDPDLGLGPHLHVILDNQPYQAVYDLDQPLVFEDLPPGTHTLRVFASRPWHESFKNEGAYAQTTFHLFTKTTDNNPDPALPLLTYSRPTGTYGAEPIMLDFYLTNAPLHLVAQENPDDDIADWRIRVTANGESFVLDRWQPVYLKGFKRGKNWVQIEFLDEQGNPVKNVFNDTVRLINYEPKGKDTLSKLVRGDISAEAARGIVNPGYKVKPAPIPSPVVSPEPTPSPTPSSSVTPEPAPSVAPSVEAPPEAIPTPELETPPAAPIPPVESPTAPEEPEASPTPSESPAAVEEPTPTPEVTLPAPATPQKPGFGKFFNRFRRPDTAPSPSPEQPEAQETPSVEPTIVPVEPEQTPTPEAPSPVPVIVPEEPEQTSQPEQEQPVSSSESSDAVDKSKTTETSTSPPGKSVTQPKFKEFFNRFRRPKVTPSSSPEVRETPSTESTAEREIAQPPAESTAQPEELVIPSEPPAALEEPTPTAAPVTPSAEPTPVIEPMPMRPIQPEKPKANSFLDRFRFPATDGMTPESGLPPTLPEIVETPFPKPAQPEAAFPQPAPESSPATQLEASPASQSPSNPEPTAATPELD